MLIRKAYKFRLITNGEQHKMLSQFDGNCRFVFNKALSLQMQRREAGEKHLSYVDLSRELTGWKKQSEWEWLNNSPSHTLQHSLKQLEAAYKNFFEKRAAFPKFKKKGMGSGIRFPEIKPEHMDPSNGRIKLPKLGWMRFRQSRKIHGVVKNATVSKSGEHWYISIQTEQEVEQPIPKATSCVGLDMGVARFSTDSNGLFIEPANALKSKLQRLARYQRAMSRKKKFSSNWRKTRSRITRLHQHIANCRRDFLHKHSTAYSQNHAMIAVEALQVKNMSTSARGDKESPGKNVRAKSGLNRSILDQGWGEFIRQLQYKMQWAGGELVEVPPQYTSQTCPCCGHTHKDNRRTQAKFACGQCGYENHADHVGAINVLTRAHEKLAAGYAVSACGEPVQSDHSVKQEPTEEITTALP